MGGGEGRKKYFKSVNFLAGLAGGSRSGISGLVWDNFIIIITFFLF